MAPPLAIAAPARPAEAAAAGLPRLAVALDGGSLEPLEPLIDALHGLPVLAKVGMSLFAAVGPAVVHHLRAAGLPVFLDLNLCDIPHQVALAVDSLARLGVELISVHASGGRAMLQAAQRASRGRVRLLGATLLTSLDQADLAESGHAEPVEACVRARLQLVADCGLAGAVLAPSDLPLAQGLPPAFLRVTPAIRLADQAWPSGRGDDQRRGATASQALAGGASILVVGRPILAADAPREAVLALLRQLDGAPQYDTKRV